MDANAWIALLVGVAVTAALFALGVVVYGRLRTDQPSSPQVAVVEAALRPIIYYGICAAYRLNEMSLDQLHNAIKGADKKKIADSIYAMLPEKVENFDLTLVKHYVTRERFEQLTQDCFDSYDRFYVEHQPHFEQLFQEWKLTNAPGAIPNPVSTPIPNPVPANGMAQPVPQTRG